ncbi:MAG: ATP-dependent DNA helicase RecG [Lachnospiraceae bacterium]|nr:ATP-dependent DNA helicase RecG [Lachnospiraceae bacterium]
MNYNTPVIQLKGVGEKTAKNFEKLGIRTVGDLIRFYPRDYEKFEEVVPVLEVKKGEVCAVRVRIIGTVNIKKIRNLTILNAEASDGTGKIKFTFFNMPFLRNILKPGGVYLFRGLVQIKEGIPVMEQPKLYKEEEYQKLLKAVQPKYPLSAGITNHAVTSAVKQALSGCEIEKEFLPDVIMEKQELMNREEAVHNLHFPKDFDTLIEARKRLVFEEFFLFILGLRKEKEQNEETDSEFIYTETTKTENFLKQLPYTLTGAQKKVWEEIKADLQGRKLMNRLVQGDVGSGKTIVAILSLLMTVSNGYQGAMMAPTEVLAKQHFDSISEMNREYELGIRPVLLIGSMTAKEKREAYEFIAEGKADIVIGTHALIQEKVVYKNLALVITDEQHRFGVKQRENLAAKGNMPHVLVMSATPIPRTLAIILYGDLKVSVIDELPAERKPIKNCVVDTSYREKAYRFIEREVTAGRQVYVICPMVEEGESDCEGSPWENVENVVGYTEKLKGVLPPSIEVAYLHGKMKASLKNEIMEDFKNKKIDVLVSTTVIEVGINVPNATVMMVENSERFGLAQLHQLRGRVGRGEHQSYCIFVSSSDKKETMERLEILNKSNDGFKIAEEDLKMRGPGDIFGIRQSGEFAFKLGDIYNDAVLLKEAGAWVDRILSEDTLLEKSENANLKAYLEQGNWNPVDFRTI